MKTVLIFISFFCFLFLSCKANAKTSDKPLNNSLDFKSDFKAEDAYNFIVAQTSIGPRNYGSLSYSNVRKLIKETITNMGYDTFVHSFNAPNIKGRKGENIYAFLKGKSDKYIVLASHYDTRSVSEKDTNPANRNKPLEGANDGASSTGVLLELMKSLKPYEGELPYSVCFVFFDLEDDGNLFEVSGNGILDTDWIQGSIAFVKDKVLDKNKIEFGILLDMVGAYSPNFLFESYAFTKYSNIYRFIWESASKLGYSKYFSEGEYGVIIDDHTPFLEADIPFVDIIDMNYKYHHTQEDTINKIDINTLKAVGNTIEYVIKNANNIYK